MPYLQVHVGKQLTSEQKRALADMIAEKMPILPGKNKFNAIIEISGACDMYNAGEPREMIFVDVRLMGPSPFEAKDQFVAELSAAFNELIGIAPDRQYYNFIELSEWGAGGHLKALK